MLDGDLIRYLKELRGEAVLYRPNPGNAGDALIAAATLDLFRRLGLRFEMLGEEVPDVRGRVVVHGGGGGFWGDNRVVTDFIQQVSPAASRVVLLPQTITGHEAFLAGLPAHVHLFCRERVSYAYVQGLSLKARVFLDHDLAFQLDAADWLGRHRWLRLFALAPGRAFKGVRRFRAAARAHPDPRRLEVRRGDAESLADAAGRTARYADISRAFAVGVRREGFIAVSAACFLRFIARYEQVKTDRLHVGIGAALLGKQVSLRPNRYFKNRAVFEHSLRGSFPCASWEEPVATAASGL